MLILAKDLKKIEGRKAEDYIKKASEFSKVLAGLIKTL